MQTGGKSLSQIESVAGTNTSPDLQGSNEMLKNVVRGILGLVLTAAATWLAGYIVDQIFGADEERA